MKLSRRTRIAVRNIRTVVLIACIIGPLYSVATGRGPARSDLLYGLVDGALIAIGVSGYVELVKKGPLRSFFRQRTFLYGLFINASVYSILLIVFRAVGQIVAPREDRTFFTSLSEPEMLAVIPTAFVVAFIVEFILQMNLMVGANVLRYFITGAYHQPKEEERVFMFLDLQGSTKLTESLGSARYFALLRDFVDVMSDPILETFGTIHEYAGDEVVIAWKRDRAFRNANCLQCFFMIDDAIQRAATKFEREYGVVPQFRAGLHGGRVVIGELGDIHQEIVFVGDILNVAARLEEYAKTQGRRLVTSAAVLDAIQLPADLEALPLGEFQPRGKAEALQVFEVRRKT